MTKKNKYFLLIFFLSLVLCFAFITCHPPNLQKLQKGVWISIKNGYDGDFSPNGQQIVFTNSYPGRSWKEDLWLYSLQTGEKKCLFKNAFWDGEARWNPAGTQIVFTVNMVKFKNIVLYNYEKGNIIELTKGGAYHPSWSPDGRFIVFVSKRTGFTELWRLNVSTGTLKQLTFLKAKIVSPAWSPDNTRIIFCLKESNQWDLWQLPFQNNHSERLFKTPQDECYPRWSKSGKYLAFCSFIHQGKNTALSSKIWLMENLPSFPGKVHLLLQAQEQNERLLFPAFSPDEKMLLFSTNRGEYRWDLGFIDISKRLNLN